MLVLSRKPGESLLIGDSIEVTVVEIRGDSVRLAIEAPREVPIWRREVLVEIKEANLKAGEVPVDGVQTLAEHFGKRQG